MSETVYKNEGKMILTWTWKCLVLEMTKRVSSTLVFARMSNGEISDFHVFFFFPPRHQRQFNLNYGIKFTGAKNIQQYKLDLWRRLHFVVLSNFKTLKTSVRTKSKSFRFESITGRIVRVWINSLIHTFLKRNWTSVNKQPRWGAMKAAGDRIEEFLNDC